MWINPLFFSVYRVRQVNWDCFISLVTFKLFARNWWKFSDFIFKLYSSTLVNFYFCDRLHYYVGINTTNDHMRKEARWELSVRHHITNWLCKDNCLAGLNHVWCYRRCWKKSPHATKGSKTNKKFSGRFEEVDKGRSNSVKFDTSQKTHH